MNNTGTNLVPPLPPVWGYNKTLKKKKKKKALRAIFLLGLAAYPSHHSQ